MYFPESTSGRIVRFSQDGQNLTTVFSSNTLHPEGLSFNAGGDLFFNTRDQMDGAVWRIAGGSPGGNVSRATVAFATFGEGTVFAQNGDLLATDAPNGLARRFAPPFSDSNAGTLFASGPRNWNGITVNATGHVFISHAESNPASRTGEILHFSENGTALGAYVTDLWHPAFSDFDSSGNLYITDFVAQIGRSPDQVVRVTPSGQRTIMAEIRGGLGIALCEEPASNDAPVIFSFDATSAFEGSPVNFVVNASDPEGDALTYDYDFDGDGAWDLLGGGNVTTHTYGDDFSGIAVVRVSDGELSDIATVSVAVTNVAPAITLNLIPSGDEAQSLTFEAEVTDPGSDDLVVNWSGACAGWTTTTYANDPNAFPDPDPSPDVHPRNVTDTQAVICGDDGTFIASVFVADDDGGASSLNGTFDVSNVAPGLTILPPALVTNDEGVTWTLTATALDVGSDDLTFAWTWEFGPTETHTYYNDGVAADPDPSPGGTFPFTATDASTHTYGDDGTYVVTLLVEDDDGGSVTVTTTFSTANRPPSLAWSPPDSVSIDEGTIVSINATSEDPGSDDLSFTWSWLHGPTETHTQYNDGLGADADPSPGGTFPFIASDSSSRTYGDDCACEVTLLVEDDDGGSVKFEIVVTVANVAPAVSASDASADEASVVSFAATFSDPGFDFGAGDTREDFTATIAWGDGSVESVAVTEVPGGPGVSTTGSLAADHVYGDDGVFAVLVTVCDDDGGCGSASATVTVNNVAPAPSIDDVTQVHDRNLPANHFYPLEPIAFNGSAIDAGSDDLTLTWSWGDGTADTVRATHFNDGVGPDPFPSPGGTYPFAANDAVEHTYRLPGDYVVALAATDDDGGVATATRTIHVTSAMDLKNESIVRIRALKQQAMDRQDWKFFANLDDAERYVLMSLGYADPYRPDAITAALGADVSIARNEGDRIDLGLGPSWTATLPSYSAIRVTWANGVVTTVDLPDDWPEQDLESRERAWIDLWRQDLAIESKERKDAVTLTLRVHDASTPFSLALDADRVADLSFAYDVRPWWTDGAHLSPEFGASVFRCERAAVDRLVWLEFPDDDDGDDGGGHDEDDRAPGAGILGDDDADDEGEDEDGLGGLVCRGDDDDDEHGGCDCGDNDDEDEDGEDDDDRAPGVGILGGGDDEDDDEDDEGSGNVTVRCRLSPRLWSDAERVAHDEECDAITNLLVKADEILAQVALADARDTPVSDPANRTRVEREIARAEASLTEGLEEWSSQEYEDAICELLDAWTDAQRAIRYARK